MQLLPAHTHPCSTCPWLTANHGKPHPHKWFSKANRRRLWKGTRNGESMSCHRTDPDNEVPDGHRAVPEGTDVHECTGLLILQQREAVRFQAACEVADAEGKSDGLRRYCKANPGGLLRGGILALVERAMFHGTVFGGVAMPGLDLNEPVSHDDLAPWSPEIEGKSSCSTS